MKRLSFRFCRRVLLLLAILFPIVYLCGGLFFALAGAHGEQMFAEPIYVEEWRETDNLNLNGRYKFVINSDIHEELSLVNAVSKQYAYNFVYQLEEKDGTLSSYTRLGISYYSINNFSYFGVGANRGLAYYYFDTSTYNYPFILPWVFYSDNFPNEFIEKFSNYGTLYFLYSVPSDIIVENNSAYTDFIFSQPFAKDNFISKLGRGVLDDTAFGFPPFRDMFNWFNESVMHVQSDDDLGVFGFGYAYYAMNVVAVYELVVLVMMVFLLPLRITDRFMGDNL